MTDPLLDRFAAVAARHRAIDASRAELAGELAARSVGPDGMARRAGYARPALMVADLWRIDVQEAQRLVDVGLATRPGRSLLGSELPPRYPALAASLESLGVPVAAVIVRELEKAAVRCGDEARLRAESALVEHCAGVTVVEAHALAVHARDLLDQDGARPRDELHRQRRSLTLSRTSDGMTRLVWIMPPATAGVVNAGIDAVVGEELRAARDDKAVADADTRTLPQRRADAAERIFRHAVTCTAREGLPIATMVVRVSLADLRSGLGVASIDGVAEPISAGAARIVAADSNLIPAVFGGRGEILDMGRAQRLFTRSQRLALIERDDGCAWGGCSSPPAYAEAHHLEWWSQGGSSDLSNGIMLCSFHHHRIHDDGWEIELREQVPYFIPPPWVPDGAPRLGGRVRVPEPA
ncbi:MAG: endonuclease [Microbacteriaceae bacterium]|nr:endonuclease [Microbacteriaceae bacterium]